MAALELPGREQALEDPRQLEDLGDRRLPEEDRLRRDIKSLTADGRLSAKVLLAMPPAMLAIISVLSPGYATPLANTSFGRMLALVGVVLGLVGWQWLRHLATPKVVA